MQATGRFAKLNMQTVRGRLAVRMAVARSRKISSVQTRVTSALTQRSETPRFLQLRPQILNASASLAALSLGL